METPAPARRARAAGAGRVCALVVTVTCVGAADARGLAPATTLARDGVARLKIFAPTQEKPAAELERYLERISGAEFERASAPQPEHAAIHVGLFKEFPWLDAKDASGLGVEGFVLRSDGKGVYLVARAPPGVHRAVATFLHRLGCRWFFPGAVWEVVPSRKTIRGDWNERGTPSFETQRRIWYGFGAYAPEKKALEEWNRHNRMGGSVEVHIGHTWHGLDPERDFSSHPEWFAFTDGKRQATKPCYSHPGVLERAIAFALREAQGNSMVSMSPPDGLGYCECERCLAVFRGGEPFRAHGTLFARVPDGRTVNVTSETLFAFVNRVAEAVARDHPTALVGCYAYSAYSHPPSFALHPNVYLQTTTKFRRTPLALEAQIEAFGKLTSRVGIREYFSAYQWDWDDPDPGRVAPRRLQVDLRFYRSRGVTAINAEASNNWGPRGLGYYVASQLMWDVDTKVEEVVRDFYEKAFGDAAPAMEAYFDRWYGPDGGTESRPPSLEALRDAYGDLEHARRLVEDSPAHRARVDQLRLYLHYLVLRRRLVEAESTGDRRGILAAIRAETVFGGRLTRTGMIHSRALIGKAFLRRFRKHTALLETVPEASTWGSGWRRIGEPPARGELQRLWVEDRATLFRSVDTDR